MEIKLTPEAFFDLSSFEHREIFSGCKDVWGAIPKIESYILNLFKSGKLRPNCGGDVYLGEGTVVEPGAYIEGPAILGRNCEVKHVAYLRENVILGDNCKIGHASEVKNSIFLPGATVAHLNYVGDSLLGRDVNLAAGVIVANFRLDQKPIKVRVGGEHTLETNLTKFGAVVGDGCRVGVNSILNPGTILGKNSSVYPLAGVKGYHPAGSIVR